MNVLPTTCTDPVTMDEVMDRRSNILYNGFSNFDCKTMSLRAFVEYYSDGEIIAKYYSYYTAPSCKRYYGRPPSGTTMIEHDWVPIDEVIRFERFDLRTVDSVLRRRGCPENYIKTLTLEDYLYYSAKNFKFIPIPYTDIDVPFSSNT